MNKEKKPVIRDILAVWIKTNIFIANKSGSQYIMQFLSKFDNI